MVCGRYTSFAGDLCIHCVRVYVCMYVCSGCAWFVADTLLLQVICEHICMYVCMLIVPVHSLWQMP